MTPALSYRQSTLGCSDPLNSSLDLLFPATLSDVRAWSYVPSQPLRRAVQQVLDLVQHFEPYYQLQLQVTPLPDQVGQPISLIHRPSNQEAPLLLKLRSEDSPSASKQAMHLQLSATGELKAFRVLEEESQQWVTPNASVGQSLEETRQVKTLEMVAETSLLRLLNPCRYIENGSKSPFNPVQFLWGRFAESSQSNRLAKRVLQALGSDMPPPAGYPRLGARVGDQLTVHLAPTLRVHGDMTLSSELERLLVNAC